MIGDLLDARVRLLDLVDDLSDVQCCVPRMDIVNPTIWEIGHVAWFQEKWTLRELGGRQSILAHADELYDSMAVLHRTRWGVPLPSRTETLDYMRAVLDAVLERLESVAFDAREEYFHRLVTYHEDMHGEALTHTRQTLALAAPVPRGGSFVPGAIETDLGDAEAPGGRLLLGASEDDAFVFDNEKRGHEVEVGPFRIARAAVTQAEFAAFVEAGGYREPRHWCEQGWMWREVAAAEHPVYWRREGPGCWLRRRFDQWVPLEDALPVSHVNWFEASAYCRWAGRRLPTEAEWEFAASVDGETKRRHPWGNEQAMPDRAHLDATSVDTVPVGAFAAGDSALGCRQMLGNVWEWTASTFGPYPGFVADPYADYSEPWFRTRKVLRGGCFATRSRMLRNTWRNFYTPERSDVIAGFRTVAL